uniref:Uncharacterized protein n=1 Tax=Oryza sativa subsp. japonica TaxID=39947 RepID=Q2R8R1_ORYSJ|nr:hypothetical protein LOC_Os11g11310 [Oryza sativa Japonica Group]
MAETKGKQPAGGGEGAMRGGSDNDGPAGQPPAMAARYWAASEGEIEGEDGVVNEGRQPRGHDGERSGGGGVRGTTGRRGGAPAMTGERGGVAGLARDLPKVEEGLGGGDMA